MSGPGAGVPGAVGELVLDKRPDAVPRARRFVVQALGEVGLAADREVRGDTELVVAELVTNAVLHAQPPFRLRLQLDPQRVRIEVGDATHTLPVRPAVNEEAMTGRGLSLVEALVDRWGVQSLPDGKVIWCELAAGSRHPEPVPPSPPGPAVGTAPAATEEDLDALLDAWAEREQAALARHTVRLGEVPTDLLIAAKAHVENLVRELVLADVGEWAGMTTSVPRHLVQRVERAVAAFAEPREAIRRLALAAAARGQPRTELTFSLPVHVADAGAEYLDALDEADAYARAARLLTLETPPQHRVFRQWYVESLVAQLRAASRGEPISSTPTFEQRLLDELAVVAAAQRISERAARLQQTTAALVATSTVQQVADVVVAAGVEVLGATGGALVLERGDRYDIPAALGYGPSLLRRLEQSARTHDLPMGEVLRHGEPVWLESRAERDERFPALATLEPSAVALCAIPLQTRGRVVGALRFSFDKSRLFDEDERRFLLTLAALTAQALDRTAAYEAERLARASAEALAGRLARLQRITADLAAVQDVEEITGIIVEQMATALGAQVGAVCLLDRSRQVLRMVRIHGGQPDVARWLEMPLEANVPACDAIRQNRPIVLPTSAELAERYPSLIDSAPGDRALICVPLQVAGRPTGAVALSFPTEQAPTEPADLAFLSSLADTCAQAIDRAEALAAARAASERLSLLARASDVLARSPDYSTALSSLAQLVVPVMADWCVIHAAEQAGENSANQGSADDEPDTYATIAIAHVDPSKITWAEEVQRRYPARASDAFGVAEVMRTGRSSFVPAVTEEMIAATLTDAEHRRLIEQVGLVSTLIVPLQGRHDTLGTLSLFYAESGRRYDEDDVAFAEELARRAAVVLENRQAYELQSGELATIRRIAAAAQRAILPPVPVQLGPVRLATAYVSAEEEAQVGGDYYDAVEREGFARLIVGDVRGKGLEAVRLATVVLGMFRSAAIDCADLAEVARRMDQRLRPYLADEDFTTAVLVEIAPGRQARLVCCGHPAPLLVSGGQVQTVSVEAALPLGLGADPQPAELTLPPDGRLLLYTDGLLEARTPDGAFVDVTDVVAPLRRQDRGAGVAAGAGGRAHLDEVLAAMVARLREAAGGSLTDDLALMALERAE